MLAGSIVLQRRTEKRQHCPADVVGAFPGNAYGSFRGLACSRHTGDIVCAHVLSDVSDTQQEQGQSFHVTRNSDGVTFTAEAGRPKTSQRKYHADKMF